MDKLDSSCPMVGPAPVEKERSDRHSQGSIYIIFSWIKKVKKGASPFIVRLLNPLPEWDHPLCSHLFFAGSSLVETTTTVVAAATTMGTPTASTTATATTSTLETIIKETITKETITKAASTQAVSIAEDVNATIVLHSRFKGNINTNTD